jgi:tetratricopeptide (TPR) repeat protein
MRRLPFLLLATALLTLAQIATLGQPPVQQQEPSWMEVFERVYGAEGQGAALGSLDLEVEKSWAAALAAGPGNPYFEAAAQQTAQYFGAQGYDRKAETILRQAIAATKQTAEDPAGTRPLKLALAQRLYQEQKFLSAAALIEGILEETKGAPDPARPSDLLQLAHLRELMGEMEAAEALFREAKTLLSTPQAAPASGRGRMRFTMGGPRGYAISGELARFYQRHDDNAKAEALFQKDLEEAKTPEAVFRARQSYAHFLHSQQRWEESVVQWETLVEVQSAAPRPEDRQMLASSRVSLVQALTAAGKAEKALEILKDHVVQSSGDDYQRAEALRFYASILIQQKKFEEAEKTVEQIRQPTGKNAAEMSKQAESYADYLLAKIRQMQNRGEEARALREKAIAPSPRPEGTSGPVPVRSLLQPVQELIGRHKHDEAMAQLQRILVDSTPRIHSNPEEIAAFTNFIYSLPEGRREERLELMRNILSTLDGVRPADHPRMAQALGQLMGSAMEAGLSPGEITRLLDRQEKILAAAKGEDSLALNEVSQLRARFFAFRGDYAEAASEMKLALKRAQALSGARSHPALQIMRELANSLQMISESWPEEESLRLALIEASTLSKGDGGNLVYEMNQLAYRYHAAGQREKAVAWMDRAIELARKNPQTAPMVHDLEELRSEFATKQSNGLVNRTVPAGIIRSTIGSPVPPPPPPPK